MNGNSQPIHACSDCSMRKLSMFVVEEEAFSTMCSDTVQLLFSKGETIFKQGGRASNLMFLHKGVVKFCYRYDSGSNYIMTVSGGPKLIGGANLFFRDINIFSITAVEDCEVCLIDIEAFKRLSTANPAYILAMIEQAMEMFHHSIFNFISLAHNHVNGRIATVLLYLWNQVYKESDYDFTLSRKELAEFAACSHENVINTLSRFRRERLIEFEGKKIVILDHEALTEISKKG